MMLLDTCALLWLAQGGAQLSESTRTRLREASVVYVSAISGFEIGIKNRLGELDLPAKPIDWFNTVVKHHSLKILTLDLKTCILSTELPPIHNDPCDRMIIAAAQIHGVSVVTADPIFAQYGIETLC